LLAARVRIRFYRLAFDLLTNSILGRALYTLAAWGQMSKQMSGPRLLWALGMKIQFTPTCYKMTYLCMYLLKFIQLYTEISAADTSFSSDLLGVTSFRLKKYEISD